MLGNSSKPLVRTSTLVMAAITAAALAALVLVSCDWNPA